MAACGHPHYLEIHIMSKKKAFIPQFGAPPKKGAQLKPGQLQQAAPPPAPKMKPQAIPVKSSGHRGGNG